MLIVNRLQLLYFALMLPMYLIHSYMIWGIIVMGILSQINLTLLSKWFSSDTSPKDYHGFVQLFGERTVRMFALVGWVLILVKITVITLSYVEVIHYFVFPSMNIYWLILFAFSISCYLAVTGMEKVIRFVVITFLASFWIILFFLFLFFHTAGCFALRSISPHTDKLVHGLLERLVVHMVGFVRSRILGLFASMAGQRP